MGAHSTIYDVEGLEFEGVFISIAPGFFSEICVRTVRVDLQLENGSCNGFSTASRFNNVRTHRLL